MAEREEGGGLLGWVKGLGLPIASLIASAAFFGIQMQQQAFERRLKNVEDGYRFYFEERTTLQNGADVGTEQALLEMLGAAFPSVYCNVRADMYKRAIAVETSEDAAEGRFASSDRDQMVSFIIANRTPASADLRVDFGSLMPWTPASEPQQCTADFDVAREQVAQQDVEGRAEAAAPETAPADGAPAQQSTAETPRIDAGLRERLEQRADTARVIVERAYAPRSETYQVFFHVRTGSTRTRESVDPLRAPLAQANFRVMRGVETVDPWSSSSPAQVRYFGPNQLAAANELVAALNEHYRSDGLVFRTIPIGEQYPNMPPTHLEVWIP